MMADRAQTPRWKRRPDGSNWGEFGPDDGLGRLNLLTPERRRRAVAEVREGIAFCLSLPLDYPGGSGLTHGLRHPPRLFATTIGGTEVYHQESKHMFPGSCDVSCDDGVQLYLQYSTQWDSLAHWGQLFDADADGVPERVYYNGFRAEADLKGPSAEAGPDAGPLGLDHMAATGVQGRGVLVNLRAIYGVSPVAVGYEALMRAFDAQSVIVEPGDILLIHTGFDEALLRMNRAPDVATLQATGASLDGSDDHLLRWITDSGVVALCSDNMAVESLNRIATWQQTGGTTMLPLHTHCLFKLGVHLGELWFLSDLANWLSAHGRNRFLLTAPPLRLPGAVGSPATPVATV